MTTNNPASRVGVLLHGSTKPDEVAAQSRFVEDLGFNELWLAEDYFLLGGFSASAIALQATKRVSVGLGIVASVVRHPAVTAMEISTLAQAYPGRFMPGIGHGVPAWTRQMGLFPKSILSTFRETMTRIRELLEGETLTHHDGHFHFDNIELGHPVPGIELYAGVSGPKSLELAGEVADGTILSALSSPAYVHYAREIVAKGQAKAGIRKAHKLPTFALYAVDKDRKVARDATRAIVAFYLHVTGPTALTAPLGINDDLTELIGRGGPELIVEEMPEEWIDEMAIAGEPEECAERINMLLDAGASSVVLAPITEGRFREQIKMTAEQVLPLL